MDKLRKTDGMAGAVRTYFSANVEVDVPHHEFKEAKQVPVVGAWNIARAYAESQGMKFSTPSLHPRNPEHAPDDFERGALTQFESNPEQKEYFKQLTVGGQEVMRYAQPVRLTDDFSSLPFPPDFSHAGPGCADGTWVWLSRAGLSVEIDASGEPRRLACIRRTKRRDG